MRGPSPQDNECEEGDQHADIDHGSGSMCIPGAPRPVPFPTSIMHGTGTRLARSGPSLEIGGPDAFACYGAERYELARHEPWPGGCVLLTLAAWPRR